MTRITTSTFDSVIDEFRRDPFNVGFDNMFDRLVDFQTTINPSQNALEVKGEELLLGSHEAVIHRGISTRDFNRRWNLADTIEVTGADFKNGLLTVHLKNVIPEEQKPRVISINTTTPSNSEFLAENQ